MLIVVRSSVPITGLRVFKHAPGGVSTGVSGVAGAYLRDGVVAMAGVPASSCCANFINE